MAIDIKHINRKIWRVQFYCYPIIDQIDDKINWCRHQFGDEHQSSIRWRYIKDSPHTYRFWFFNNDDYVAFNLAWLNE